LKLFVKNFLNSQTKTKSKMTITSVIIADDHIIFRKGLRTILNEIPYIKVIAEASNGLELLEILKNQSADVILMDLRMPEMDGITATENVMKKYPNIKIIALTMHEEIGYFNKMIEAGAAGFLLKKTTKDELDRAISAVINDENYFSEEFICSLNIQTLPKKQTIVKISDRELEVLELICKGLSNNEISKILGLSQRTIDGHKSHLFDKTGAKNAPNLVMYAIKHGLIKT